MAGAADDLLATRMPATKVAWAQAALPSRWQLVGKRPGIWRMLLLTKSG